MTEETPPVTVPPAAPVDPAPVNPAPSPAAPLDRQAPPAPNAPPALSDWYAGLSDELRADKTLELFKGKSVEDVAKGLIERQKMIGNRVPLPSDDDPNSFTAFAAAVRPEKPDGYTIDLPEGTPTDFADHMRQGFFDGGLHPKQAEIVLKAYNGFAAQTQARIAEEGVAEVEAIKARMGPEAFERSRVATNAWLTRMNIPTRLDADLVSILAPGGNERLRGAGASVELLFDLVSRTGEMGKVSDTDVQMGLGTLSLADAKREADKMVANASPEMVKALRDPNSSESKRLDELAKIIAKG